MNQISIIIPTFNEAGMIGQLLRYLQTNTSLEFLHEIIVVDGGSEDGTVTEVGTFGVKLVQHKGKGRAVQMNAGAAQARGNILYFLHADTFPPAHFDREIVQTVNAGWHAGNFRMQFDERHWLLDFFCWFTRFTGNLFQGGDQSLFITRELFQQIGGFREDMVLMEDIEIYSRIKQHYPIKVLPQMVTTSIRKYKKNGIYRLQCIFAIIQLRYYLGASPQKLYQYYQKNIR